HVRKASISFSILHKSRTASEGKRLQEQRLALLDEHEDALYRQDPLAALIQKDLDRVEASLTTM
ncbi:hypothetical protein BGZ54_003998, partial [Gamsiella multidivaricata]